LREGKVANRGQVVYFDRGNSPSSRKEPQGACVDRDLSEHKDGKTKIFKGEGDRKK